MDDTKVKTGENATETGKYRDENSDMEVDLSEGDTAPPGKNGPTTFRKVAEKVE